MKRLLKKGLIPACLINPALIRQHNENSPEVARIGNGGDNISLDALLLHYASDGVSVRKYWRDTVFSDGDLPTDDTFAPVMSGTLSRAEKYLLSRKD